MQLQRGRFALKKKQEKIMLISLMNNYIFSLNYMIPVNQYPKLFLPVSQQEHSEVLF